MASPLDTLFNHYLVAVLRDSDVREDTGRWTARVHWLGEICATAPTEAAARTMLHDYLAERVFTRMRTGLDMPVVAGISINGGSC